MKPIKYLFRYFDTEGIWENKHSISIEMDSYEIIKETPKGYWIKIHNSYYPRDVVPRHCQKFVLAVPKRSINLPKRWAYLSPTEAWKSFVIRKIWQESHLQRSLKRVQRVNKMIEINIMKKNFPSHKLGNFLHES